MMTTATAAWVERGYHSSSSLLWSASPSTGAAHHQQQQQQQQQQLTRDALQIVQSAIDAVDPVAAVKAHFQVVAQGSHLLQVGKLQQQQNDSLNLKDYDQLLVVAFGKASSAMAQTVLEQFPNDHPLRRQAKGVVLCKDDHATPEHVEFFQRHNISLVMAAHPVPDERSTHGAQALMELVHDHAAPTTLVICCISGGGSSLFCQPANQLSLQDLQAVNTALLVSGMGIQDMNVIRKRLETGKGGRLAAACHPSQLVTLVLSDVLGDPLDLIASGPTVPDTSTFVDAWELVERYSLHTAAAAAAAQQPLPESVLEMLRQGVAGTIPDSPSADHPIFQTAKTVLVGNNALAVEAAARHAQGLGYHPVILGTQIEGEAKEIAHVYTGMALYLQQQHPSSLDKESVASRYAMVQALPAALIAGGETTVSLTPESGKGGRNQELALSAALQLDALELSNVVLASVGTDGTDGPTDAAGAVVDSSTVRGSRAEARLALANHNAYPYLDQLANGRDIPPLIKTGPTGTNVADICVTLVGDANTSQDDG